ncbi:MAG: response regulator transcription factor [Ignavibacteria bacterium]|nr:response regulator transcription factor [Ignavibacteria bacterium]
MKEKEKIKLIFADDHPIFRNGLKNLIIEDHEIDFLGEAENGEKALTLISEFKPDIALLDIDMPKMTGLEVLKEINKNKVKVRVIFLSVYASEDIFDEAMELGISGYVLKDGAVNEILECIHKVYDGEYYISPAVSNLFINRRDKIKRLETDKPALSNLTKTEMIILKYISQKMTSKEIAEELFISIKTVENHRTNISNKLGLKGSHSLLTFAIENRAVL